MLKRKSYVWTPADEAGLKQMAEKGAHVRAIALSNWTHITGRAISDGPKVVTNEH